MTVRRAFTLIEVVVTLAVGGGAIALAAALTRAAADESAAAARHAVDAAVDANGERLLRRLVGQMELPELTDSITGGDARAMLFSSWCDRPEGWQERCRVSLRIEREHGGIAVGLSSGESLEVLSRRGVGAFVYLRAPQHGGRWSERWISAMSLPPAIGIVVAGDTLILRIEERG